MLLAQEKYQVWHYPDSGSCPSSIIAWACDFFSASISQRVSEAPALGVDRVLVKNGDSWTSHCWVLLVDRRARFLVWLSAVAGLLIIISKHAIGLFRDHSSILDSGKLQQVQVTSQVPGRCPFPSGNSDSGSTGRNGAGKVKLPLWSCMLHVRQIWLRPAQLCSVIPLPRVYDRKLHC